MNEKQMAARIAMLEMEVNTLKLELAARKAGLEFVSGLEGLRFRCMWLMNDSVPVVWKTN